MMPASTSQGDRHPSLILSAFRTVESISGVNPQLGALLQLSVQVIREKNSQEHHRDGGAGLQGVGYHRGQSTSAPLFSAVRSWRTFTAFTWILGVAGPGLELDRNSSGVSSLIELRFESNGFRTGISRD